MHNNIHRGVEHRRMLLVPRFTPTFSWTDTLSPEATDNPQNPNCELHSLKRVEVV